MSPIVSGDTVSGNIPGATTDSPTAKADKVEEGGEIDREVADKSPTKADDEILSDINVTPMVDIMLVLLITSHKFP